MRESTKNKIKIILKDLEFETYINYKTLNNICKQNKISNCFQTFLSSKYIDKNTNQLKNYDVNILIKQYNDFIRYANRRYVKLKTEKKQNKISEIEAISLLKNLGYKIYKYSEV